MAEISTNQETEKKFKGAVKPGEKRNPTGKGGLQDRPQDRSNGRWDSRNSISYQYNRMIHMSEAELEELAKKPKTERTVAERLAYQRVLAAQKSLADMKEITDRTEGKAKESIDLTTGGDKIVFGNLVPRNKAE